MKSIPFFRMLELSELATTTRDLTPLLQSFREYEPDALRVVEEHWTEIVSTLGRYSASTDVAVLISGRAFVLPRADVVALTITIDPRISDAVARSGAARPLVDVVVELGGRLFHLQVEHRVAPAKGPQIDWSRSFSLWDARREKHAHYVFLDTGEAVITWCNLASLLGLNEEELGNRADATARAFTIAARHGDAEVLCVRIDLVQTFLSEIERTKY